MSADSVAQDQIRAFVERILRMKEEAKAINDDIREIYAEAKGNGYDKTVLGQVVSYVEKRAKDNAALLEREALFDLYMAAFDGGSSHARACAREIIKEFPADEPDHDPLTGEIIEHDPEPMVAQVGEAGQGATVAESAMVRDGLSVTQSVAAGGTPVTHQGLVS